MEEELKELRNIAVFSFTMMNAIFVLIVFLLQLNKDTIHIEWPLGVKTNITFVEATSEVGGVGRPGCVSPSIMCVVCFSPTETSRDRVEGTEKQIILQFLHAQRALCAYCIPSTTEQRRTTHRLASRHQGKHHNYPRDTGGNLALALLLLVMVVLMAGTYFCSGPPGGLLDQRPFGCPFGQVRIVSRTPSAQS